jgi:hypothetical protein
LCSAKRQVAKTIACTHAGSGRKGRIPAIFAFLPFWAELMLKFKQIRLNAPGIEVGDLGRRLALVAR